MLTHSFEKSIASAERREVPPVDPAGAEVSPFANKGKVSTILLPKK